MGGAEPGEFCGGGARRGGAGLFILGAMLLLFLFSFVFLSPLLIEVKMLLMNRQIIQWLLQVLLGRSLHFFITIKKLRFLVFSFFLLELASVISCYLFVSFLPKQRKLLQGYSSLLFFKISINFFFLSPRT